MKKIISLSTLILVSSVTKSMDLSEPTTYVMISDLTEIAAYQYLDNALYNIALARTRIKHQAELNITTIFHLNSADIYYANAQKVINDQPLLHEAFSQHIAYLQNLNKKIIKKTESNPDARLTAKQKKEFVAELTIAIDYNIDTIFDIALGKRSLKRSSDPNTDNSQKRKKIRIQ